MLCQENARSQRATFVSHSSRLSVILAWWGAVLTRPSKVRAFDFRSGKLRRKYDESRRAMEDMIANGQLKMDAMDLGKKSAVEKELEVSNQAFVEKCQIIHLSHCC